MLSFAEDHVNPNLLFVGTEFGLFFTVDGGKKWIRLRGNLPTIPVRDLAIQERENDLVLATFGRGFYVLDDYSPLRQLSQGTFDRDAHIFPTKAAVIEVPEQGRSRGSQGEQLVDGREPANRRAHHLLGQGGAALVAAAPAGCDARRPKRRTRRRATRRSRS